MKNVNSIYIYQLNSLNLNSNWTFAGQLRGYLPVLPLAPPRPNAHHEDYRRFFSSGALAPTLLSPPHPSSRCLSAACNMHRFPLTSTMPLHTRSDPGTKDGNLPLCCSRPDQHGNWFIPVKLMCMLSSASETFI